MLPDRYHQLLTAYVDGELHRRQLRQVERLLKHSPEARQLLTRLQADARALRRLPRPQLQADLTGTILQTIADRGLQPIPNGHSARHRPRLVVQPVASFPAWTGLALAASTLFVIGLASYYYFSLSLDKRTPGGSFAKRVNGSENLAHSGNSGSPGNPDKHDVGTTPAPLPQDPPSDPPIGVAVAPRTDPGIKPPQDPSRDPSENPGTSTEVARTPSSRPWLPRVEADPKSEMPRDPGKSNSSVLTAPDERFDLKVAPIILPSAPFALHELDQAAQQQRLTTELGRDNGFRLELPTLEGTRALERLLAVCKAQNIRTFIEPAEQLRLKNQLKASHAVYLEGIQASDLIRLLEQLGSDDRKARARRPADGLFDRLVLVRMQPPEYKDRDLVEHLGIDKPKDKGSKRSEQRALVVSYPLTRSSRAQAEVKQYLETRQPVAPGTLQVLLVLRHLGN